MSALVLCAVVLALGVGCGVGGDAAGGEAGGSAGSDELGTTPVLGVQENDEASAPERRDGGFVASGESSGGEAGAADRIEDVRFRVFDGYERVVIEFGRDGGEAGVPSWSVESPEEGGFVRLRFPGVRSTATAHEDLIGSVLDELYVVRDGGGGLFADVFGAHEFRYRVTELPDSGRLAVDFRGVPEEIDRPPTTGDRAVVLQPREAEEVESPIEVRGYARLFEGAVTVELLDRGREVLASRTVRATDWTTAWGRFEATLPFSGYEGLATIRVGGRSAKDGSFVGTETEVFLEGSGPG